MSFNPIDRLRTGNIEFIFDFTTYDRESVASRIREHKDRLEIIKAFLPKLIDHLPSFCFSVIYDMDEFKDETMSLITKYPDRIRFDTDAIKNILYNTNYGNEYVLANLDKILNDDTENRMVLISEFAFSKTPNKAEWVTKLSRNMNLHYRALFMLYLIKARPEELSSIYDDLSKYLSSYTGLVGEQLRLFDDLMNDEDVSEIVYACFNSKLDKSIYIKLKEYLLSKYKENDLALYLLKDKKVSMGNYSYQYRFDEEGFSEFKGDADRLFATSKNYQFEILKRHSELVSKELMDKFRYYVNYFSVDGEFKNTPLFETFIYGLGGELKRCVDQYLDLSTDKTTEYINKGSTSSCFRLGDYAVKLSTAKWSYEDVICPNIHLIVKNLEERFVRDNRGVVVAALEVQKYLRKSAEGLPSEYFARFYRDLKELGYYTTDTLMGGTCGDNCRVLDSYKDADCANPELLPAYFKEVPLVLVDRDRIYSLNNRYPKQLRESMD